MAELQHVLFNTLEQLLSADLNRAQALAGKHEQDLMVALLGGTNALSTPRNYVLRGLNATAGAGMSVDVSAGRLLQFNAAPAADQSQYRFGFLPAAVNLAIAAADPVNPRIDRISATIADVDSDAQVRNTLTLPNRIVVPVLVNKTRTPQISLTVTTGVAGVAPVAPATPAGAVALWDVFVPGAAVAIDANHMIALWSAMHPFAINFDHRRMEGFLVSGVANPALTFTLQRGHAIVNGMPAEVTADRVLTAANFVEGGGGLVASTEYHAYAIAAGSGQAVGSAVTDQLVILLSTTAPNADGRPSAALTYNALQGVAPAATADYTTTNALYIGTLRTNGSAQVEQYGGGVPGTVSGSAADGIRLPTTGQAIGASGFIRRPRVTWVDAQQVQIGDCYVRMNGWEHHWNAANAHIVNDRAAGEAAEAPSTWYYVYLRHERTLTGARGAVHTLVPIVSSSRPTSRGFITAAEAGFVQTDYLYVGSFFNNAASNVEPFFRDGHKVLWRDRASIASGGLAVSPAKTTITAVKIPPTTRIGIFVLRWELSNGGADVFNGETANVFHGTGGTNPAIQVPVDVGFVGAAVTVNASFAMEALVSVSAALQFEGNQSNVAGTAVLTFAVDEAGYVEDLEAIAP